MIAICQVCAKKYTVPVWESISEYKCECGGDLREDVPESKVFRMPGNDKNNPLISCPDCGRTVSRRAAYCPSCGGMVAGLKIPTFNMIQIMLSTILANLILLAIAFAFLGILFLLKQLVNQF